MSLTSHLKDSTSPIGQFIKQYFAQTVRLTKVANQQLKGTNTLRPVLGDGPYPYAPIGTAIDYRIRYAFEITPYQQLVAWEGATLLTVKPFESDEDILLDWHDSEGILLPPTALTTGVAQGPYALSLIRRFFNDLQATVNMIQPKGRRLEIEAERTLDRYCIVLSFFEQVFRSNNYLQGPLMQPVVKRSVEELLAIPQDSWIDDLSQMFSLFYDRCHHLLTQPHILNPTFVGSFDIGGADADLVIAGCLIDIKASVSPQIKAEYLYQLAGYLLLDYDDQLHLDSVGIYLARQGVLFTWPIPDFLHLLTGDNTTNIASLRQEFLTLCENMRKRNR